VWAYFDYQEFLKIPIAGNQPHVFEVKKGSPFNKIINQVTVADKGFNKFWFKILARQIGVTQKLKAGEYTLPIGIQAKDFLLLLSTGKVKQYRITFPEGWSFKEMRFALKQEKAIKQSTVELSDSELLKKIDKHVKHPEGLFFPDTYQFTKNTSDIAILKQAYQKMQLILEKQWQLKDKDLPLKSAYEALILASIVEKETGIASERPIIAGVFTRRLKIGMRLQTDPTVIYGMGENYKGNIRRKDLATFTPYNTYKISGLPPTPIAMPGEKAIHAVLHPMKGNSLYFVANGDGSHIFSATLRAHNNAVNNYQRKR
jgi:UPF0755 protein